MTNEGRYNFIRTCRTEKRMSFEEIGIILNISRQRVHQIYSGKIPTKQRYIPTVPKRDRPKQKQILKEVSELKVWNKRKREFLGLPTITVDVEGGIDFIRELIRARDNYECKICFKKWKIGSRRLDVHHLDVKMESIRDINYDRNNMDKMITLCHKCHLNIHTVKEKMVNNKRKLST